MLDLGPLRGMIVASCDGICASPCGDRRFRPAHLIAEVVAAASAHTGAFVCSTPLQELHEWLPRQHVLIVYDQKAGQMRKVRQVQKSKKTGELEMKSGLTRRGVLASGAALATVPLLGSKFTRPGVEADETGAHRVAVIPPAMNRRDGTRVRRLSVEAARSALHCGEQGRRQRQLSRRSRSSARHPTATR